MKQMLLFCLLLTGFCAKGQTVLYVDSSMAASGSGASWSTAYKTLGEALSVANAAGTSTQYVIRIARGTYYPTGIQSSTNLDSSFLIFRGGVKLYGGYPTGGGVRNEAANAVVLSGNINSLTNASDNSRHVMVIAGISATADSIILDGLQIAHGYGAGNTTKLYNGKTIAYNQGGGLCCYDAACKLLVNNCGFYDNITDLYGGGGGMMSYDCTPVVTNCSFTSNASGSGGGLNITRVTIAGVKPVVSNCTFTDNLALKSTGPVPAYGQGGGIYDANFNINQASSFITNCTFLNNTAELIGGGLSGGAYLHKCIFIGNSAGIDGGGAAGGATIDSCNFTGNSAGWRGGGLNAGQARIVRCSFTADSASIGGGLYGVASNLENCSFIDNKAFCGGGAYLEYLITLADSCRNSVFLGNTAISNGGGIYVAQGTSRHRIFNCLFSGNKAGAGGGGMCDSLSAVQVANCTFSGNNANHGNAIFNWYNAAPTFLNCIIWDGAGTSILDSSSVDTVAYSIVQGPYTLPGGYPATGVFSFDPQFVSPLPASTAPTAGGDYRLTGCSPAIDAGYGSGLSATDLAGNARLYGSRLDLGAYEYQAAGLIPRISGPDSICLNASKTMSISASGGTWASSDTSVAAINASGVVTAKSAGATNISYSPAGSTCPAPAIKVLIVSEVNVDPITGGNGICIGVPDTLSSTTPNGVWSSTNTGIATVSSSGVVSGVSTGTDTIRYTVTSSLGCVGTAAYAVYVGNCGDSVWAGDANADKMVSNLDALSVALSIGGTGPARVTPSLAWVAQACVDWASTVPGYPGVNLKHADCNGDGIIDFGDAQVVRANYGRTHPKWIHTTAKATAGLPDLRFDFSGVAPVAGTQVTVPIKLGSAGTPMPRMAGLAARIMIDWVLPQDTPRLSYTGSWLGLTNQTLNFDYVLGRGRTDWAYCRVDHRNNSGYDTLALMTFTIPPGTEGQKMLFYFDDVVIVDSAGQVLSQYNVLDDTVTIQSASGITGSYASQAGISVFPNPSARGECRVQLNLSKAGPVHLELRDLSGRLLYQYAGEGIAGRQEIPLPAASLSPGVYIIQASCNDQLFPPLRWTRQ